MFTMSATERGVCERFGMSRPNSTDRDILEWLVQQRNGVKFAQMAHEYDEVRVRDEEGPFREGVDGDG